MGKTQEKTFLVTVKWSDDWGSDWMNASELENCITKRGIFIAHGDSGINVKVGEVRPDIKVGDRVRSKPERAEAEVTGIRTDGKLRVRFDDGVTGVVHDEPEWLIVIPKPGEPQYHVERVDDELRLLHTASGGQIDRMSMSDPELVRANIERWEKHHLIDADKVRELIAVPTVIGESRPTVHTHAVAIRLASGWYVALRALDRGYNSQTLMDPEQTIKYGEPLNESDGRGLFPRDHGPYLEKP